MLGSEMKWREFFLDRRLQEIIETALENNRDLRAAALNVERARAFYRVRRADLLPTISASASGFKERVPADLTGTGCSMTVEQYNASSQKPGHSPWGDGYRKGGHRQYNSFHFDQEIWSARKGELRRHGRAA